MKDIPLLLFRALYLPLLSMLSVRFRPACAIQANFIWYNFQMLMKFFLYHCFQKTCPELGTFFYLRAKSSDLLFVLKTDSILRDL